MVKCNAITSAGERCQRIVGASQSYCYSHDPARAFERKHNASRAAKAKGSNDLVAEVKDELRRIAKDVESGTLQTSKASVMVAALGSLRHFIALERGVAMDELEKRLDEIERKRSWR